MKMTEKLPDILGKSKHWFRPSIDLLGESRSLQILSSVLILQLVIAGGLLWRSNLQAQFAPATQLVSIDPSIVDTVIIDDGDDTVSLQRADDQWRLDDQHNTPASGDKIENLVSDITALKPGLPVTSTRGAHKQLEVAEGNYQRQVTLKVGEEIVADLLMGTSPGFRKSHVRHADQDEVFSARLNTFDIPADYDDWLNQNLLSFDNITGIQTEDIDLAFADDQWSIVKPEKHRETHVVDKSGIDSVISQLTALRVNGFTQTLEVEESTDAEPGSDADEASEPETLLTHTLTVLQNDKPITLVLSKLGNDATIERSDISGLFELPVTTYDALTSEVVQGLIIPDEADVSTDDNQPQG